MSIRSRAHMKASLALVLLLALFTATTSISVPPAFQGGETGVIANVQ